MYVPCGLKFTSLVPRLSPSRTYVHWLTFAQVRRLNHNYACAEEGEPGDEATNALSIIHFVEYINLHYIFNIIM